MVSMYNDTAKAHPKRIGKNIPNNENDILWLWVFLKILMKIINPITEAIKDLFDA